MSVGEQQIELAYLALAEFHSEIARSGSAIHEHQGITGPNFKTRGFSPVTQRA